MTTRPMRQTLSRRSLKRVVRHRYLPLKYECTRCGSTAAEAACYAPVSRMEADQRATLEEYGIDIDQVKAHGEIALCGNCGNSHWDIPAGTPNDEALRREGGKP